jgi:hypothetical protein
MSLRLKIVAAVGFGALVAAGGAAAQDSLGQGKTPAQLFASDCASCHKSPQGLAKSGGLFGVQSFLRQHYTASKESAAAIAGYLEAVDRAAGPAPREARPKRAKGDAKPAAGKKTEPAKPGDAKTPDTKTPDAKPADSKAAEPKASEAKPTEAKPAETKPVETKPAETKPAEAKPVETPKTE